MRILTTFATAGLSLCLSCHSPAAESTASIPMRLGDAATFYIQAAVGDLQKMDFMVDTGSGYMTINQATLVALQRTGQAQYQRKLRAVLANGTEVQVPVYRLTQLALGDCRLNNVEAAVLPGTDRQIIGLNALQQADSFTFSFNPPQLQMTNCPQAKLLADARVE